MPLLRNPQTGEVRSVTGSPEALLAQGWREPTDQELEGKARELEYGTSGQLLQAQAERVGRGLTFGQFEGVGTPEEIRARAEVSEELQPGVSLLADIAPDVALSAATGGLGAAAKVGRLGVLAAESAASGAVTASQQAFGEGRQFLHDDIGADVENTLLWTGLGGALGARAAAKAGRKAAGKVAAATEEELVQAAQAAEAKGVREAAPPAAAAGAPATPAAAGETVLETGEARTLADTAEGIPTPATAPLDREAYLQTLPEGAREAADEELEHEIADLFQTYGRKPELGTDAYRIAEQEVLGQRVAAKAKPASVPGAGAAEREAAEQAAEDGFERALRNASKSEAEDIVERAARGPAGDATGKAAKSFERAGVEAAEEAAEAEGKSLFRDRRLYQNREAILETATREMQSDVSSVMGDLRKITDDKTNHAASNIGANIGGQRHVARDVATKAAAWSGQLKAEARQFAAESGKKGLLYAIPGQKSWTLALLEHAKELGGAKTGKEMFERLNTLKQVADDFKVSLERGAQNSTNPIYHERLIPKIQEFANGIRQQLEDAQTWGTAGDIQRAYNSTFHDKFFPSFKVFEESVLKRTHQGYDAIWKTEGWETKIRALLESADPGARRHVATMLDAMKEFAETRLKYGGDRQVADNVLSKVDKMRRTMGLADEVVDATGRMEAAGKVAQILPIVGPAARAYLIGDLGSAFRRLTGATDAAVSRSVDDWIASSKVRGGSRLRKVLPFPRMTAEQKALYDLAKRRGVTHAMARFMGEDESPLAAFERRKAALFDDDAFFERLSQDFGGLQAASPEAFMLLSGKIAEARQFLTERMPANVAVSVTRPGGYPPNREAIEDWAVYWNAVEQPTEALKHIPSLRMQEIETLQKLCPRLWERTQQTVLEKIGDAQVSGEPLDDTLLMRLDVLFGFDGAGSPAFSHRAVNAAQAQAPAPAQGGGATSRAPTTAKRMMGGNPALTGATFGSVG